jgi:formylglycine-generating enzyme required for sulfatase activity
MMSDVIDLSAATACCPRIVEVPAGEFLMGASANDKFTNDTERPPHLVRIARFGIGMFPVTTGEFRAFRPDHSIDEEEDPLPVVNVSWHDARAYCKWLSDATGRPFRLPTEAEWEYACRAGTQSPFFHGPDISTEEANFLYDEHGERTGRGSRTPAGNYAPNAFGLLDMHGNVCEWCEDSWHLNYHGAPSDGSAWIGSADDLRVIRGGAWDYLPRLLRSSWRDALPPETRRDNVGFRVAVDLP